MLTTIFSIISLIVGVLLGHILTAYRERQRWLADQKKDEYRELIDLLYDSISVIADERPGLTLPADSKHFNGTIKKLARAFEDRIFIAKQLKRCRIPEEWLSLKRMVHYDPELQAETPMELRYSTTALFRKEDELRTKLIDAANEDIVSSWFY